MLESKLIELENQVSEKSEKLDDLKEELETMENDPSAYFEDEIRDRYDSDLDEQYEEAFDNFPFVLPSPSEWMKENEPTTYRVGFADYSSDYNVTQFQAYRDLENQIDDLENEIECLNEDIEEIQDKIDELNGD